MKVYIELCFEIDVKMTSAGRPMTREEPAEDPEFEYGDLEIIYETREKKERLDLDQETRQKILAALEANPLTEQLLWDEANDSFEPDDREFEPEYD